MTNTQPPTGPLLRMLVETIMLYGLGLFAAFLVYKMLLFLLPR